MRGFSGHYRLLDCCRACGIGKPVCPTVPCLSYDLFRADEDYVAQSIAQRFAGFSVGQPFLDLYRSQVAKYLSLIEVIQADFTKVRWCGEPIEVLHVDLDKSYDLHRQFLLEYYPHVILGHGLIAHQDWYLSRHPWIHFGMEYLSDYMTLVDSRIKWCTGSSVSAANPK